MTATNSLSPLVRRPDHDEAAVGAGDRPADEHQVVVGVDADDVEVADGDAVVAVLAGHADALLRPAAAAVAGVGADASRAAVALLDAVAWRGRPPKLCRFMTPV